MESLLTEWPRASVVLKMSSVFRRQHVLEKTKIDHHRTGFRNKTERIDNSTLIFMRIHNKKYSEAYKVLSHNGLFFTRQTVSDLV